MTKCDRQISIAFNQYTGEWDINEVSVGYTIESGYKTKREALEALKTLDQREAAYFEQLSKEAEEKDAWENAEWPNIAWVRERISRMRDPMARIDAGFRLDALMSRDLHEHICGWPLPTQKQIETMDSDRLTILMSNRAFRKAVR